MQQDELGDLSCMEETCLDERTVDRKSKSPTSLVFRAVSLLVFFLL